jgi:LPXTG-site transpeptidase (sortase) family protein
MASLGLDNPIFKDRIYLSRRLDYRRRPVASVRSRSGRISDVAQPKPAKKVSAVSKPKLKRAAAKPAPQRLTRSSVLKREAVKPLKAARKHNSRRRSLPGKMLAAMAAVLFVFGLGVGINGLRANKRVVAQVQTMAQAQATRDASGEGDAPQETKPTASDGLANYHVAPNLPRVIRIPKIGVEARVKRVSTKANNELGAPASIFDAGWYEGSSLPGEVGAALIDGHVSGPTQNGVFYNLKKLAKGDRVVIEKGDGKVLSYHVVDLKVYDADKVDMAAAVSPATPGKNGLNLITCTGQVDKATNHFKQRLVVFTAQD